MRERMRVYINDISDPEVLILERDILRITILSYHDDKIQKNNSIVLGMFIKGYGFCISENHISKELQDGEKWKTVIEIKRKGRHNE